MTLLNLSCSNCSAKLNVPDDTDDTGRYSCGYCGTSHILSQDSYQRAKDQAELKRTAQRKEIADAEQAVFLAEAALSTCRQQKARSITTAKDLFAKEQQAYMARAFGTFLSSLVLLFGLMYWWQVDINVWWVVLVTVLSCLVMLIFTWATGASAPLVDASMTVLGGWSTSWCQKGLNSTIWWLAPKPKPTNVLYSPAKSPR